MKKSIYQQASFLTSAAQLSQLPKGPGMEVAFVGRSNAGKSSALNALTGQKGLARTSKTPGRTQLINLFALDEQRRLVDLPGYGYAEVAESIKQQWQQSLAQYLQERDCLKGLILLMDIRHPLKETDQMMLEWCISSQLPCHILLTKADKLSRQQQLKAQQVVQQKIALYKDITVQVFSAHSGLGMELLAKQLDHWFEL